MQVSCLNILFLFLTKFLFHTINLQLKELLISIKLAIKRADYMCVGERGGVGLGLGVSFLKILIRFQADLIM